MALSAILELYLCKVSKQSCVTLKFDLLILLIISFPRRMDYLCQFASQLIQSFSKCRVHTLVTKEEMDRRMDNQECNSTTQ